MRELIRAYQDMRLVINLVSIAILVFQLVYMWIIFTKAGEGGWKVLIPIYNVYIRYKISNAKKRFWACFILTLAIPLVLATFIGGIIHDIQLVGGFPLNAFNVGGILAVLALALATMIIGITVHFSMAKAFGLPGIFGLGLWLLPIIFYPIVAFCSSIQYAAPKMQPAFLKN